MIRRVPRTSPDVVQVEAVLWDDVVRHTRVPLSTALRRAYVLTIGGVCYEDEELLVLAQELDPSLKHWLKGDIDPVRIKKGLIVSRTVIGSLDIRARAVEDEVEEDEE